MIVNSDERQWGWMDEGLNSFVQIIAEQDFGKTHPDAIPGLDHYPSDYLSAINAKTGRARLPSGKFTETAISGAMPFSL